VRGDRVGVDHPVELSRVGYDDVGVLVQQEEWRCPADPLRYVAEVEDAAVGLDVG